MELVKPKVHLVGVTQVDAHAIQVYLEETGNLEFMETFKQAISEGISAAEALCSMFAKLCYKSLTTKGNKNISRVRDIRKNIEGCFNTGHGSVFEHCGFNFIITDCSRVFTHEIVRHRVGTAFSQTSGRYVRSNNLQMVLEDPIVDKVPMNSGGSLLADMEAWAKEIEDQYNQIEADMDWDSMDMNMRKKVTSYLRRMLPGGQANEIGFTCNLRTLRHLVQMRTSRYAEWEIRYVFEQIFNLVRADYPMVFFGATTEEVDGVLEISGMRMQPYEDLCMFSDEEIQAEAEKRGIVGASRT